jgi:hypothetical protein
MNRYLALLDRLLEQRGEDIYLRRRVGSTNQTFVEARIPAIVRPLTVQQLVVGITQQNYFIIISMTHIIRQQWPGGAPPPTGSGNIIQPIDPRIPLTTDFVFLRGGQRAVQRVAPVFDAGDCIRIEMTVRG